MRQTATPFPVTRSSGSRVSRPTNLMSLSWSRRSGFVTGNLLGGGGGRGSRRAVGCGSGRGRGSGARGRRRSLAGRHGPENGLLARDLADDLVGHLEKLGQLGEHRRGGLERGQHVEAFPV